MRSSALPLPHDFDLDLLADSVGASALVTGGAGFIGSRLCDLLAAAGLVVHAAGRRPRGPASAEHYWQVDLVDVNATHDLVRSVRPDFVFHLASHVWGAPDVEHVTPTFQNNLQTTVNILTALVETECRRFIVTGSLVEPIEKSGASIPNSPYTASKWASSDYVRMFHALYGVPGAIARVFMVYGPAQQDPTKLVPYVIRSVLDEERPKITSGEHLIDWVYIDDVAYGLALMAVAPGIEGSTIDLGSGALIRTVDLVERICELMGGNLHPLVGALPDRPMEPTRVARASDTEDALGWSPRTPLIDGLNRTIDWYRDEARSESARR